MHRPNRFWDRRGINRWGSCVQKYNSNTNPSVETIRIHPQKQKYEIDSGLLLIPLVAVFCVLNVQAGLIWASPDANTPTKAVHEQEPRRGLK